VRFLSTGSLTTARGPRRLVGLSLVFFACFLFLQWLRLYLEEVPPEGLPRAALLEALHLDAFFFGMFFLFVEAVRLRLPDQGQLYFWLDLGAIVLIMSLRILAGAYPVLSVPSAFLYGCAFIWLFVSLGRLFSRLYRS